MEAISVTVASASASIVIAVPHAIEASRLQAHGRQLITVWLEVRVLPGAGNSAWVVIRLGFVVVPQRGGSVQPIAREVSDFWHC
jgi:hypothetical protein